MIISLCLSVCLCTHVAYTAAALLNCYLSGLGVIASVEMSYNMSRSKEVRQQSRMAENG
jgi:hypothetical protein